MSARATRLACAGVALTGLVLSAAALDRLFPPETAALDQASTVIADRDGAPLRIFITAAGRWRLPVAPEAVSTTYRRLLLAIEDKRFASHPGVDPLSMLRAVGQLIGHGRIVSGGSTLTMQVVRLLHPRPRTLSAKLVEIARALQLEAHWSKARILAAYLALAPMGGNIEGVRAGSLIWFGKEPADLSDAEAALLVALPQNPTGRRPDRHPAAAQRARDRLLARGVAAGVFPAADLASAEASPVPHAPLAMPMLAPHLAEQDARTVPPGTTLTTTLSRTTQAGVERLLAGALATLPRPVNLAAIVADRRSGAVLARAGSAGYADALRHGAVDMSRGLRSPGSTLKPFIYGMAFDGLLAHPGSLLHDAAMRFDDYAPHNFDGGFNGDVTVRQALQLSLNLPAVVTLQRLGPVVFTERLKQAGLPLVFPDADAAPGLPVALGGEGATLETLVAAYAGLANGGTVRPLSDRAGASPAAVGSPLFGQAAADAVVDILSAMPPPAGRIGGGGIAFKTGTSYRFRDGWAIGFDDARVIGVWMGRADGASCACVGAAAAGLLFRLFDALPPAPLQPRVLTPFFAAPPPPALVRLDAAEAAGQDGPHITFPVDRSRLLVDQPESGGAGAVKLAANGGRRPYHWSVDGEPVDSRPFAHDAAWTPGGEGFSTVSVIDADGRAAEAKVRITRRSAAP